MWDILNWCCCCLSLVCYMMVGVSKIVVQVKLTPSPEQAAVLASTLRDLNTHATWVARWLTNRACSATTTCANTPTSSCVRPE